MKRKKLLATTFGVMISVLVLFTAFKMMVKAADITQIAIGDVNADGAVDALDALTVLKVTARIPVEYVERVADVNGDASIDASDALNILKYVAGMGSADELLKYTFIRVPEREDKCISISSLEQKNITMSNAKIITYNGEMTYEKQKVIYTLIPSYSGNYRLDFAGMISGLSVDVKIYDSSGYLKAATSSGVRNDNGITASLKAGETYKIYVTQRNKLGSYTMSVGYQKQSVDISNHTKVFDSIEYTDQENVYKFTVPVSRDYRFDFSEMISGLSVDVKIYDSSGYLKAATSSGVRNDRGITASLEAGETYTIYVSQKSGLGEYMLKIN